jgi:hypothetical protein
MPAWRQSRPLNSARIADDLLDPVRATSILGRLVFTLAAACTAPNPAYRTGILEADTEPTDAEAVDGLHLDADRQRADAAGAADGGPRSDRLVGYWRFDESAGAMTALDSSGNGNHGQLQALDPSRTWVPGRQGNAIRFAADESGEAGVRVPFSPSLAPIREFTVCAWIYRTGLLATQNTSVISRQLADQFWEIYNLSTINTELVIYAGTDVQPAPRVRVNDAAPLNVWIHVAATYDGAQLRLYRDGEELGATPLGRPLPTGENPLYIGTNKNPQRNDVFIGLIDEVALYSVALPAASIRSLFEGKPPASL